MCKITSVAVWRILVYHLWMLQWNIRSELLKVMSVCIYWIYVKYTTRHTFFDTGFKHLNFTNWTYRIVFFLNVLSHVQFGGDRNIFESIFSIYERSLFFSTCEQIVAKNDKYTYIDLCLFMGFYYKCMFFVSASLWFDSRLRSLLID